MTHRPRQKKVNKPGLQLRLIGTFLAISAFAAYGQALLLSQALVDVSLRIQDSKVAREVQDAMPELLVHNLLWTSLLLLPLIVLVGVHVTHRIAGPAHGIERYLRSVVEQGGVSVPCKVRKGDELQNLAESINRTFDRLRQDRELEQPTQPQV
ncbi:MAG: hypothetical protein H6829_13215 [Planctomycetes bacterium]|nr:hypothetical protein [Planctomycetota bacterium]MCB9911216.1 hypothetical protein [Planctomycetota bacterium]MCB9911964.1 hypothetical protein [Planctomycetota bacterium]HPF13264.1 hypothetical protein [Planctomycetota bacterium]HRV80471.1 hypothetical protein [Planctomycetota bacterium]